jgi:hypothetical protein
MSTSEEIIRVDMTRHDAALFILFQQYYDRFGFMTQAGVWDIRDGNAKLHFDKVGNLLKIEKQLFCYPVINS